MSGADRALEALAERVEQLTGPDRLTEANIHVLLKPEDFDSDFEVGGLPANYCYGRSGWTLNKADRRFLDSVGVPCYTASLDAAMLLVPANAFWSITMRGQWRGGYHACCQIEGPLDWREAATPALALTAAALRALAQEPQP